MRVPEIKKRLSSYLLGEEGKISKQTLMIAGSILAGASLVSLSSQETNAIPRECDDWGTDDSPGTAGLCGTCKHTNSLAYQTSDTYKQLTVTHSHKIDHCSY